MGKSRIEEIMDSAMIFVAVDADWPNSQGLEDLSSAVSLRVPVCLVIPDKYDVQVPEIFLSYTGNKLLIRGQVDSPENAEWLIQFFTKAGIPKGSTVTLMDRPY